MSESDTRPCLFVSREGGFSVRHLESPLQERYQIPPVPPGMSHAIKLLGLRSMIRVYRRTANGRLPIYEEE